MKKYVDKNKKEAEEYKVRDVVLLSMKKLTKKFVEPYKIKKIISENTVELELLALMKIHPVVNVSRIAIY